MIRTPFLVAAVLFAASCSKDTVTSKNGSADPTTATTSTTAQVAQDTAPKGDVNTRLDHLEKKVDKIIAKLEEVLPPPDADPTKTYSVPIDPRDPVEGPADAKVTIVEGFEFACPYCYQASSIIKQLQEAYPNDVRLVNKYMVVHQPAIPAGLASCAANKQGKFPELKKTIWEKAWGADGRPILEQLTPEALEKYAADLGMNVDQFKKDMNSEECQDWLEKSETALHDVGQNGTPGFYVNGRPLGGLVPLDSLKQIVDEEKGKADKAIAGGVAQADYYQKEVVEKGEKKVPGLFDVDDSAPATTPAPAAPAPTETAQ